jgi:hypothetical protein
MNKMNNNAPIQLRTKYGSLVNGYQHQIIRPFDSVHLPRDLKRDNDLTKCNWPCYAGSNYQDWCSEKNAIWYHAMAPIIEPNQYNELLKQLFALVVGKSQPYMNMPNVPLEEWSSVFCGSINSTGSEPKDVMKMIMTKVAEAVRKIPDFNKNSTWGSEQFHYTDEKFFTSFTKDASYYNILFNLYNPLRSISTMVQVIVEFKNGQGQGQGPKITYMDFINSGQHNNIKQDDISSFNDLYSSISTNYNDPAPTEVEWNYGNTLLDQQFNAAGFYDPNNNIKLNDSDGFVPSSLKPQIKHIEGNYNSFLMPCGTPNFTGTINKDMYDRKSTMTVPNDGLIRNVNANPQVIYNFPLQIDKQGKFVRDNQSKPIAYFNT